MLKSTRQALCVCAALLCAVLMPALQAAPNRPTAPPNIGGSSGATWDTYSDTWVGTDALGRALPTSADVGPPRANKTVGMFYFLTFDEHGDGPYDNSKILAAHPNAMQSVHDPAWGPLNKSHYWGEPLFGYYASDDPYVLRKHAVMLANAGVDVVIFDNSNNVTYDKARDTLCQVWETMRRQGSRTPQIAFLCPFGNSNGMGSQTLTELYDTLYAPGRYKDLWFLWKGKPLVMASPSYAENLQPLARVPAELLAGSTLGQTFVATKPFTAVSGEFPTWNTVGSGMTLSLYADRPGGQLIARRVVQDVVDNSTVSLIPDYTLPAGRYYLEISNPIGRVGWWGYSGNVYAGGTASEGGTDVGGGGRALHIQYSGADSPETLVPDLSLILPPALAAKAAKMRAFFTFRTPIPEYNNPKPPLDSWAWLQIFPQAPQRDSAGNIEQVTVGVAQNYNAGVNGTAPMSFPGAFSRSYHDGHLDTKSNAVDQGLNFAEQWQRALQLDPPFIFVTGWNEWTAGFYDSWASFNSPPPIFVDEFDQEGSRDIEPMTGGHGDDYYYQLVSEVRRYKGVRALPPVTPKTITLGSGFRQWDSVQPEFRHDTGLATERDWPGVGSAGPYVNHTGRNDIVAAKVAYDKKNVYFYVRTAKLLTSHTDPDWMLLYLNVGANYGRGWLGYNFVLNRHVGDHTTSLEANVDGAYAWKSIAQVHYTLSGDQMEIAVPRAELGIGPGPAVIDFKWADHCYAKGDWTDFTLNGDCAPDDRFNYRAKLGG